MHKRWLLLFLLLVPVNAGADWPGWRGPAGLGISSEKNLPTKWSASENVRWKVPLQGIGVSTPIVWQDHVFVTASEGRLNDRLLVMAFDRKTGRSLWQARFFASSQPEWYFPPGGMAIPTPATDGQRLYALFGTGDLVGLDFAGNPVWIRSLAEEFGPFRNRWGMAASPILVGDLLVVLVDHFSQSYLLGVDARTGTTRWKTDRDANVNWSSPLPVAVNGKTQLVVSGTKKVKGYDAGTGKEIWSIDGMQEQCIPTPVAENGIVYAVSGRKGQTLAIRLDSARGELTDKHVAWSSIRGAPNIPSGLCLGGHYYLVDDEGFATCFDARTGAEIWRERLGGRFHASPVAADGKVYYTNMQGLITVARAGPKFEVLAKNNLGETVIASPVIAHGQVFIRGERYLYCIAEASK
jgi:outer membrane protein assembly factor BamB